MLFLLFLAAIGCTASDRTKETLEKHGFTDIEVGGWAPFACGQDDVYKTKFEATNPSGQRIDGVVCCGWFKNCTLRL